jgi:hypothetical protein
MSLNVVLRVLVCKRMHKESIALITVQIHRTCDHNARSGVSIKLHSDHRDR